MQILFGSDLGSGMSKKCGPYFSLRNSLSVIGHTDIIDSAALNLNRNRRCTGIDRILDQFLYYIQRSFHNLTGSDFINCLITKYSDHL